jgi:hypothetical protein
MKTFKENIKENITVISVIIFAIIFTSLITFIALYERKCIKEFDYKKISDSGIHIQDEIRYDNGREVGYSISYHLREFVIKEFNDDFELAEKYKTLFIKELVRKMGISPFYDDDKDKDFKVGIIDGFNFSWDIYAKQRVLDNEKDKIIEKFKIIIKEIDLPVQ